MEMLRRTRGVNQFGARIPRARFVFLGGLLALFPLMLGAQVQRPGATVANDPLRVHPENQRYFTDGKRGPDGSLRAVYLSGSHTWNNLQHNGVYPPVDYEEYLDFLEKHAYFDLLHSRVKAAQKRGIYVSVMLFQGWSVERKGQVGNPWRGHPFNGANNINGIDGDLNGDGQGPELHTLQAPEPILDLQRAYLRQVIDTVNHLDNVLYEIGNEMHAGSVAWQYRVIEFIRDDQKTKPKQHPIGMTGAPIPNKALFESPADWISPTGGDGYNAGPPPADGRKVINSDVDHVWPKDYRRWVWKSFTRGLHTAFMDLYGATRIGDKDVKTFTFEEGRLRL
jgi:hypothetical protein